MKTRIPTIRVFFCCQLSHSGITVSPSHGVVQIIVAVHIAVETGFRFLMDQYHPCITKAMPLHFPVASGICYSSLGMNFNTLPLMQ
jgi:hypothetical protein